ncbi:MAG: universal stress protein [Gammaproteobacteria bacterium]|nr:universal stress protein [Gammaproteobacteria bacterium]
MEFKEIIVHVDDSNNCAARIAMASDLAVIHDARLIGVYYRHGLRFPTSREIENGTGLLEAQQNLSNELEAAAQSAFSSSVENKRIASEWRACDLSDNSALIMHARYVDLVVIEGGFRPKTGTDKIFSADGVVIEAGRPVLLLPPQGRQTRIGRHILVAWNASREAARALNDALPLLKRADSVRVISLETGHIKPDMVGVLTHLSRHRVKAITQSVRDNDGEPGEVLLGQARNHDIDLIVMGAYGHARLREISFGGTTAYMLKHSTIPMFMSH